MIKNLLFVFIIFLIPVTAQELNENQLDSLYNTFLKVRGVSEIHEDHPGNEITKCGFGIVNQIKGNLELFSPEKQILLKSLVSRPTKQTSVVSPSGFFRIHYNTTGNDTPSYNPSMSIEQNVNEVAAALDSSYRFEINFLGYPQPPSDNGAGGDNLYDVYISNLGGVYGYTEQETHLGDQKFTSFIVIEDDYDGFPSTGFKGLRATVAHEFHHAIQMGNYIYRDSDIFFYEITSTAFEEFVYDEVNDYYFYMGNYFDEPEKPFASFRSGTADGYDLAIWNIYLKDKFGFNILRRQWELMPQQRALQAIAISLSENGTTFPSKLNEFGIWTFFTGYRTISGEYFDEAANYPLIHPTNTFVFNSMPVNGQVKPTSNNFIKFTNSADTLTAILTNGDFVNGINNMNGNYPYEYILTSDSTPGSTRLTNNYFAKLDVSQPTVWAIGEVLNNQVVRQDSTIFPVLPKEKLFAYPNPFYYNKSYDLIRILIDSKGESEAYLNVYTPGMELVYSSKIPFDPTGRYIEWSNINSLKLSSGVYIYAIRLGEETFKGKLVIFNE
ncbi:MAG TPA: MXAN_6640 family putative metalloprotease [Ignavibacteriaceae bacterium]|nr:MXAN_6640 family putative metalloprotease [Ignavibacteriaceae bacterium]